MIRCVTDKRSIVLTASRQPPPSDSKPEAMNFPQTHYEMSSDIAPFVPPQRYPSPPRNMWYEVPKEKPAPPTEKPKPIFPWEAQQARPTRFFADDVYHSEPEHSGTEGSTIATSGESKSSPVGYRTAMAESFFTESSMEQKSEPTTPVTPTIRITPSDPWAAFTRVNAWDDDPAIEKYVDAMPLYRKHRSQGSLPGQKSPGSVSGSDARTQQDTSAGAEWRRRGSKLTDFPTAVERPSLPVTPAPIRRPKFWGGGGPGIGDEDEDDDQLPAAEGVPRQTDWVCVHGRIYTPADCFCDLTNLWRFHKDPVARLQLLAQQQSELLLQRLGAGEVTEETESGGTMGIEGHDIPKRSLPFGSDSIVSPTYVAQSAPVQSPQPVKPPGTGPRGILDQSQDETEATPRSTTASAQVTKPAASSSSILEPSFQGPGAAWDKDEVYLQHSTALPPSEEEKDVLET